MNASQDSGPRRRGSTPAALPRLAGLVGGAGLVVAGLLPWYSLNIAPPFSASSVSGWDSTAFAKAAMALGVVVAMASAARVLDDRGVLALERPVKIGLDWTMMVAGVAALALVGFRLVVLPDPADLLSRQIGLYLAVAAGVVSVLGAIGQLASDE